MIIFVLVVIAIPHQLARQDYEKVEYNVNYLQIKVQDYYRDNGMYPYSVLDMIRRSYLEAKGFENPYTNTWQQVIDGQATDLSQGQIAYEFVDKIDMRYRITARAGNNLIVRIGK